VVDADDALIDAINAGVKPDFFQAHGSESPERVAAIMQRTGVPVIKAIKVKDAADIEAARAYAGTAAMVLFDAKAPETLEGRCPAAMACRSTGVFFPAMAWSMSSCSPAGLMRKTWAAP
jgi:phosphoribosylanthranilate isomerase